MFVLNMLRISTVNVLKTTVAPTRAMSAAVATHVSSNELASKA